MSKRLMLFSLVFFLMFAGIWMAVSNDLTASFDDRLLAAFKTWNWLSGFSMFGSKWMIGICSIALILFFWFQKRNMYGIILVVVSVAGGYGLNTWIKNAVGRERPPFAHGEDGFSFPSGHTMLASIYLLLIAYVLGKEVKTKFQRMIIYTIAFILVILTGASRLARQVHYPTDVIAGGALGASYLIFCTIMYEFWSKKQEN
ncbi:phosphatase PAP2 family protein [Anoxybacteroides tepidamans]|uniref:phosphatase PAP2 family protein n=1 Tax=Anoxybacteroides tepidamans TaxID=265948 RepID=UPI0004846864|nr:phosphatase PAP2 family protein [Anoxybacillus tepidamans]